MDKQKCKIVALFTDGACRKNPGPGGWAAILRYGDAERELSGGEANTTNNRMELTAVIKGLEALKERWDAHLSGFSCDCPTKTPTR